MTRLKTADNSQTRHTRCPSPGVASSRKRRSSRVQRLSACRQRRVTPSRTSDEPAECRITSGTFPSPRPPRVVSPTPRAEPQGRRCDRERRRSVSAVARRGQGGSQLEHCAHDLTSRLDHPSAGERFEDDANRPGAERQERTVLCAEYGETDFLTRMSPAARKERNISSRQISIE